MHSVRYEFSRPKTAYPKLPVHVHRVTEETRKQIQDNRVVESRTVRREWFGSFPTQELAEGRVMLQQ